MTRIRDNFQRFVLKLAQHSSLRLVEAKFIATTSAANVLLILAVSQVILGQTVCPDPAKPCGSFKPYELPFRIPRSRTARAEDRSELFYAIILRTATRCSIPESDRISAQQLFSSNKVFVSRFECDPEDSVNYTTIDRKYGVLAVYGGKSLPEAKAFLETVRKTGRFSGAYLRRMRAVLVHP